MGKKTRIPDDFEVSPRIMQLAAEKGWPDPRTELDAFKDYHLAHGSLMMDWEAAFRTWLRNSSRWGKDKPKVFVPTFPKLKPKEPEMSEEERSANRRKVGTLLHDLVKKYDVRKAHEKI